MPTLIAKRTARRNQRTVSAAPHSLWARARAWNGDERRSTSQPTTQARRVDDVPTQSRLQRDLSAHQFLASVEAARAADFQRLGLSYLGWSLLVLAMGTALGLAGLWVATLHTWSFAAAALSAVAALVNGCEAIKVLGQARSCRRRSELDGRLVAFLRTLPTNTPDSLYASLRAEFNQA